MTQPVAIDLFCGAGGAAMGLSRAGFRVIGVDIKPQPRYPFEFHQADALEFDVSAADFIWASPPCQRYTALRHREDLSGYADLVEPTRALLHHADRDNDVPWVIENVVGAPLRPDLMLCGQMFGLRCFRHRIFESSIPLYGPIHYKHENRVNRRGENRREHWGKGGFITVTGDVGTYCGPEAMGIDWMTGDEMSEAIPPAYAQCIGEQAIQYTKTWASEGMGIKRFIKMLAPTSP